MVGWTALIGFLMLIGIILMISFFVKAGKELESSKGIVLSSRLGGVLFLSGIVILIGLFFCSINSGKGYIAQDKLLSHPLEKYGIYETVSTERVSDNKWIVILRNQRGTFQVYLMDSIPPKVFKVVPTRKGKKWVHEYEVYQKTVIMKPLPQEESFSETKTDTNQQPDDSEIKE